MNTSADAPKKRVLAGQYEVLEIIGRGASSVVYRARYLERDQSDLAIKVLLNKDELGAAANRLRKEALAMVAARHKYILRLDDFHSLDSLHYLTMELAPHSDLRRHISALGRPLTAAEAERYFRQMAEALSFVHNVGIIHRDIKPDNILVLNDRQLRLGDFSASLLPGEKSSLEELQKGIGSLDYLAPEVLNGEAFGTFSDVYALGITFYECITGFNPLASVPIMDMLTAREDENFPPVLTYCPDLNRGLASIIMKCLSYDHQKRFKSGSEILKALEANDQALDMASSPSGTLQNLRQEIPAPEEADFEDEIQSLLESSPFEDAPASFEQTETTAVAAAAPAKNYNDQPEYASSSQYDIAAEAEEELEDPFLETPPALAPEQTNVQGASEQDLLTTDGSENEGKFTKGLKGISSQLVNFKQNQVRNADKPKSDSSTKNLVVGLITICLVLILGYKLLTFALGAIGFGQSASGQYFHPYAGGTLTFPNLPEGSYQGQISGLIPNQKVPLIIFSYPESGQLKLILGTSGAAPLLFDYDQLNGVDAQGQPLPLIIRQSGYLLELRADSTEPNIKGTFVNVLSQEKGSWELTPAGND